MLIFFLQFFFIKLLKVDIHCHLWKCCIQDKQAQSNYEQSLNINLCTQMKTTLTGLPMYAYWPGSMFVCVGERDVCARSCLQVRLLSLVCVCMCIFFHARVCVRVCAHICVCVWACVCLTVCTAKCMHEWTCMQVRVCVLCIHVDVYVCTSVSEISLISSIFWG